METLDTLRHQILEDIARWRNEFPHIRHTVGTGIGQKCYAAAERIVSMSTRMLLRHSRDGWVRLENFAAERRKSPGKLTFGDYIAILQDANVTLTGSLIQNKAGPIRLKGNLLGQEDFVLLRKLLGDRNRFVHEDASLPQLELLFEQIRKLCNSQFCITALALERQQPHNSGNHGALGKAEKLR